MFPRFYFLSNDELLDILAHSKNPEAVQPHLAKCFANVQSLEIQTVPRQPPTVKNMRSAEGEALDMPKSVALHDLNPSFDNVHNNYFHICALGM